MIYFNNVSYYKNSAIPSDVRSKSAFLAIAIHLVIRLHLVESRKQSDAVIVQVI